MPGCASPSDPWSSGQLERQVNRLKLLSGQCYGRTSFDLLGRRILMAAGSSHSTTVPACSSPISRAEIAERDRHRHHVYGMVRLVGHQDRAAKKSFQLAMKLAAQPSRPGAREQ
jgi:hypothetical protein